MKRNLHWFILAVVGLMFAAAHLGLALRGDTPAWADHQLLAGFGREYAENLCPGRSAEVPDGLPV